LPARLPLAILTVALAVGAYLRCANLATLELSADEGASWAAASAPTLGQVIRLQTRANPGELGLHDAALHLWMGRFGDSLVAMRSLSAAAGTVAILLVFMVVREVLALAPKPHDDPPGSGVEERAGSDAELAAALAALIFAVNLIAIKYSREARMYPLALALTLAQVWFFARSLRAGTTLDYACAAMLTALAVAATFTASLILVPEGLYLALVLAAAPAPNWRRVAAVATALGAGLLLIAPFVLIATELRGGAPNPRTWAWIPRPTLGAPITLFNKATGTYGFPLLAILAVSGVARQWRRRRPALNFLLLWMFAPPVTLTIVSYVIQPAFVERYLLASFVPFFILAALGLLELKPAALRPGAVALVAALALAHVVEWDRKPHGVPFAEATAAAATGLAPTDTIGVAPRYAAGVIRYSLRDAQPPRSVVAADAQPPPTVVIIADTFDPIETAELVRRYPRPVARFDGVVVRGR
jgi:mannosyltransferase